jgi:hypothetical protein
VSAIVVVVALVATSAYWWYGGGGHLSSFTGIKIGTTSIAGEDASVGIGSLRVERDDVELVAVHSRQAVPGLRMSFVVADHRAPREGFGTARGDLTADGYGLHDVDGYRVTARTVDDVAADLVVTMRAGKPGVYALRDGFDVTYKAGRRTRTAHVGLSICYLAYPRASEASMQAQFHTLTATDPLVRRYRACTD